MIDKTYLIILKQLTKMRKILTYAVSALALASCSSDSLVSDSPANTQAPIAFNVGQKNITRVAEQKLEDAGYYNFGVWAYKTRTKGEPKSQQVMGHYLVGYSNGSNKGYDYSKVTNKTTWFYEGLGSLDYNADEPYVKSSVSANTNQYLRYWDYSYDNTIFYAYAPYNSSVDFIENSKTITIPASANVAGTSKDFIYTGKSVGRTNYNENVSLQFKHLGAKVMVRFFEAIPGYRVQLIDVVDDDKSGEPAGIQATPAKFDDTATSKYSSASFYTSIAATINYTKLDNIEIKTSTEGASTSDKNLKFSIPSTTGDGVESSTINGKEFGMLLPEAVSSTTTQNYAKSPTTYYAVVQPDGSTTGFTFHVSYKLIAKDNAEEIIVRDARVFVPADLVKWESNKAYTYNFKIVNNTTGTTLPTDPDILITDPSVPDNKGLYPIVFDNVTIVDYSDNNEGGTNTYK